MYEHLQEADMSHRTIAIGGGIRRGPQYVQAPKGTPTRKFHFWNPILRNSTDRTSRGPNFAELTPRPPTSPSGPTLPGRSARPPTLLPPPYRPPHARPARSRISQRLISPHEPLGHACRPRPLRSIALNSPKSLSRRKARSDRDRDAPEPRDTCPSPTSHPVTIQLLSGRASRAAQA